MTLEELMAKIKSYMREDVASDEKVADEILGDYFNILEAKTEGLKTNKETILGEKKVLAEQMKAITEQYQYFTENEVTAESYQTMKEEYDGLKTTIAASSDKEKQFGDMRFNEGKVFGENTYKPKLAEAETKTKILEKDTESLKAKYLDSRKMNELDNVLRELNAKPDQYWKQGFVNSAIMEYNESTDTMEIQIKTPGSASPLPLADWKSQFPDTPEGKRIIPAKANLGGGGPGGGGQTPDKIENMGEYLNDMFHVS